VTKFPRICFKDFSDSSAIIEGREIAGDGGHDIPELTVDKLYFKVRQMTKLRESTPLTTTCAILRQLERGLLMLM
jgi:hypothetical protein